MSSDNSTTDCTIYCKENVTFFLLPCNHYSCIKCVSKLLKIKPLLNSSTLIAPPLSCLFCRDELDDEDKKLISEQIEITYKLRNKRKERELNNIQRKYALKKIKLDNDEGCLKRKIKKSSTNEKSEARAEYKNKIEEINNRETESLTKIDNEFNEIKDKLSKEKESKLELLKNKYKDLEQDLEQD
ncbi:13815_t:CDS:1 [Cetraspora pellucida]|uniref:13815_t:CDS:1 n=1 Tax=Cetraspora pellucida TaxID=1433469 RepID=A0ACA9P2N8_9GLOM|nr:13815_t:CDS:1 [Cetraspora pellucida]